MPASHSTRELLIDLTQHPHKCFQQTWKTERKVQIEQCSEKETLHKIWIPILAHCIFSKIQHSSLPQNLTLPDRTHKLKNPQCVHFKLIHSKTPYSNKWYHFHVLKSPSKPPHLPPHSSPKHVQEFLSSIAMQRTSKLSASPSHLLC
jgi:hypothetical protein